MKAFILNSGRGSRMGSFTNEHPKCMTEISNGETILSRQLRLLAKEGITDVVITTGYFDDVLIDYCDSLKLPMHIKYVKNEQYDKTNYIYSIYCARQEFVEDDMILMHGDLVFEESVLNDVINRNGSCVVVSTTEPLSEKDFKAVIVNDKVEKIGIEYFDNACSAQALYRLTKDCASVWLGEIVKFCERGKTDCYAEAALNEVSVQCGISPLDIKERLCAEIDTPEDLQIIENKLISAKPRTVYMSFAADMVHSGHISIIKKAANLGRLIIGILSDEAVASYKRYPLLPFSERAALFANIKGVSEVVEQKELSYRNILAELQPDYVVHGDDWREGNLKSVRDEVCTILESYGGELVEFPYSVDEKYKVIDAHAKAELALPDVRRGRLKKMMERNHLVTAMEAHSGITGLIVENTCISDGLKLCQFDAMWISSLCDSTAKGKPDIELVDMTSRFRTVEDIMEVTSKPVIFDGDTGGLAEHFVYTVRTLERMGVSMVIIEDKEGLKKNSLFGTEVAQSQSQKEEFCEKIRAGKKSQRSKDFMICARIESLILEKGMNDALERAFAYVEAGADAIMIHSRKKEPDEIFTFIEYFREKDRSTYIVLVPTTYTSIREDEWKARGVNAIIYANQFTRAAIPAMQNVAELILKNHRAEESDDICMSFKEIIRLIPEEL